MCIDYRNPVVLAKEIATLDFFSDGRLEARPRRRLAGGRVPLDGRALRPAPARASPGSPT